MTTAAVILAAGESKRLGEPKQLLEFRGSTLIEHAIAQARAARCDPIVVITGAYAEQIEPRLHHDNVQIVRNENWEAGQGGSLAAGIRYLQQTTPITTAALVLLCDQPLIKADHLRELANVVETQRAPVAATRYETGGGVPACFAAAHFDELASLSGSGGAKELIRHRDDTVLLDAASAHIDVDTHNDVKRLDSIG